MVSLQLHDIVGLIGVAAILSAYFLLQTGRLAAETRRFSVLNGLGAALVLVSLYYDFNLSAFIVEGFWLVFSVIGFVRALGRKPVNADSRIMTESSRRIDTGKARQDDPALKNRLE